MHLTKTLLFAVSSLGTAHSACDTGPIVRTPHGPYRGIYLAEFDQELFLGIPYANSPRLRNPEAIEETWLEPRSAEYNGPTCCALCYPEPLANVNVTVSEHCLNLNIRRPAGTRRGDGLPVAVWIYGGGFVTGFAANGSQNTSYIGQASVENGTPMIAVTINYRLGFLGFPGGTKAQAEGITNLGLKDQRMALRWLQENAESFGGDPRRVTLWGQSAGANSIGAQILAYGGEGADELFSGAIMVSGAPFAGTNMLSATHPNSVEAYDSVLSATGCDEAEDTLRCLREEASFDDIWAATAVMKFPSTWPMIDGDFIQGPPQTQMEAGQFSTEIKVMVGANNDEGLASGQAFGLSVNTDEEVLATLKALFPSASEELLLELMDLYPIDAASPPYSLPVPPDGEEEGEVFYDAMKAANLTIGRQYRRFSGIMGDHAQIGGRRLMAELWAAGGGTAYSYRFDTNPTSIPITETAVKPGFAMHSAEMTYFFLLPPEYDMLNFNPSVINISSHLQLSRGIADKLIAFIATGDPNSYEVPSFPQWPEYAIDAPTNMVLNAPTETNELNVHVEEDTWRKQALDFWNEHGLDLQIGLS